MTEFDWIDLFSGTLQELMNYYNMDQAQLARESGLSKTAINNYIHGRRSPSVFAVINMANALGIGVEELIDFGDKIDYFKGER